MDSNRSNRWTIDVDWETGIKFTINKQVSAIINIHLIYDDIKNYVQEYNNNNPESPMVYNLVKPMETSWLMSMFTFSILPMLMLWLFGWLFLRKMSITGDRGGQLGFGKAKAKSTEKDGRKATFEDVAGADEEKEELFEIVVN